ncbi:MAG TPA: DUF1634 domain-containing protein [Candidatus Manganitrophaceae bacterium]|nr:DUF1634 domain-containing protein [Candidatus Manganitrophaceae bacterium]
MKVKVAVSEKVWTEQQIEERVGNLLRFGVLVAAMIVFLGGLLFLLRHGSMPPRYSGFQGEPSDLRSVSGIISDALSLRSRGLIQLGLLLLIATPIARVAFLTVAFARQRDRIYAVIALVVLALLFYSLSGGFSL